jgi:hypothetical protein
MTAPPEADGVGRRGSRTPMSGGGLRRPRNCNSRATKPGRLDSDSMHPLYAPPMSSVTSRAEGALFVSRLKPQLGLNREEIAGDDARRLRAQKLAPTRPAAPRRRLQPRPTEKTADARWRHPEAELAQLAADPPMAPARILPRQPQHQLPNLSRQLWPSALAGRLSPLPAHKRSMPTQQRTRRHQQHATRRARQMASRGRQQRPISPSELRPRDLPTQNLELVAQHQELNVFHMQAATATNKRPEQSPHSEIEEREGRLPPILPTLAPESGDTDIGALQPFRPSLRKLPPSDEPSKAELIDLDRVRRRDLLGGLIHEYQRAA